jgi:hypothetical protein
VGREPGRHFRYKKRECLKEKINELARNSKSKNNREQDRGINKLKRRYKPRNKTGDTLADSRNIVDTWKSYSSSY